MKDKEKEGVCLDYESGGCFLCGAPFIVKDGKRIPHRHYISKPKDLEEPTPKDK